LRKKELVITAGGAFLLLAFVHLLPAPMGAFLNTIQNAGHTPVYGCLVLLIFHLINHSHFFTVRSVFYPYLLSGTIAVGIGILFEILQIPVGREPSIGDLIYDFFGIAGFLCIRAYFSGHLIPAANGFIKMLLLITAFLLTMIPALPVAHRFRHSSGVNRCGSVDLF